MNQSSVRARARDVLVLWCLTNYDLAFLSAFSGEKTKQNSRAQSWWGACVGREATLIAPLAGLDACGPAWCVLVTNACSNELALLGVLIFFHKEQSYSELLNATVS